MPCYSGFLKRLTNCFLFWKLLIQISVGQKLWPTPVEMESDTNNLCMNGN